MYRIFHMSNWKLSDQHKREVKLCLSKCESHLTHSSTAQQSTLGKQLDRAARLYQDHNFMLIVGIKILPLGKIVKRLLRIKVGQSPTLVLMVLTDKLT